MTVAENAKATHQIDFSKPYGLLINGQIVESNQTFEVYNPANNLVLAQAPDADVAQLDAAVAGAKRAFPAWAALSWNEREAYIATFAEALEANKEEFMTLLTLEQGKPRETQASFEVNLANPWVREIARNRLEIEVIEDTPEHTVEVHRTPLGVVGGITPWNYPYLLCLWKMIPALMAGNTVVLKPSPYTPLCTLRMGELAAEIFPAGVLNILSGGNELGQRLTEHPDIAKLSFTGSTATGKRIMASGAETLKRVTLELGGNDPAILLPDADWQALVPEVFWTAFGNSGQWCCAAKRIYVHRSFHTEFVKAFVEFASQQKVGDGMDSSSVLGPVNNRMQYNKLRDLFADIRAKGYDVPLGGTIDESLPGNFVPVTVVDNPPEKSRIVQEEPFGPVVPIIVYDDIEEVIAKANDSPFGLGATVWGCNRVQALAVGSRIESGNVWINEGQNHPLKAPFGGHKQSGLGVEHGAEGLAAYTNSKTLMIHK